MYMSHYARHTRHGRSPANQMDIRSLTHGAIKDGLICNIPHLYSKYVGKMTEMFEFLIICNNFTHFHETFDCGPIEVIFVPFHR